MTFLSDSNVPKLAANMGTILFAFFILFQLLLAVGVVPVSMAWGGRQTELTPALRVASIAAVFILGLFIYVIRYRAGLLGSVPTPLSIRVLAWVVTGYMALNVLGNFTSLSNVERFLFGPLSVLLAVSCLLVALSPSD